MYLPGMEEASEEGYGLQHFASDHTSATYTKAKEHYACLHLTITVDEYDRLTAVLETFYKMVHLGIDRFSFPHKLFRTWEQDLLNLTPV